MAHVNGNYNGNSYSKQLKNDKMVTVVLGAQWGDEGKGKIVDLLAQKMDIVCRCQVSFGAYFSI